MKDILRLERRFPNTCRNGELEQCVENGRFVSKATVRCLAHELVHEAGEAGKDKQEVGAGKEEERAVVHRGPGEEVEDDDVVDPEAPEGVQVHGPPEDLPRRSRDHRKNLRNGREIVSKRAFAVSYLTSPCTKIVLRKLHFVFS